jgi:hypothetical protein
MKKFIFWNITPLSTANVSRRFGGTHRLHLQGRKANQVNKQQQAERTPLMNIGPHHSARSLLCLLPASCEFLASLTLSTLQTEAIWFSETSSFTGLQGIISQNTELFKDIFINGVRFPAGARNVVAHPASYPTGARG